MWTCPKCERELAKPNQWHQCVRVNISDLFKGKKPELEYVFDRLLADIVEWEDIAVSATKNCIVFAHRQTFLVIRPMKKQLDIKFYSEKKLTTTTVTKSIPYSGRFANHVRISTLEELTDEVYTLIRNSYILL